MKNEVTRTIGPYRRGIQGERGDVEREVRKKRHHIVVRAQSSELT